MYGKITYSLSCFLSSVSFRPSKYNQYRFQMYFLKEKRGAYTFNRQCDGHTKIFVLQLATNLAKTLRKVNEVGWTKKYRALFMTTITVHFVFSYM